MSDKHTNMGVQLMPLILVIAALCFWQLQAYGFSITCFGLSLFMWVMIFAEHMKK